MDPLNWLLATWLAVAAFIFVVLQKIVELWPPEHGGVSVDHPKRPHPSQLDIGAPNKPGLSQQYAQIRDSFLSSSSSASASSPVSNSNILAMIRRPSSTAHESVEWLNDVFHWFFYYYRGKVTFLDSWCHALNEAAKKQVATTGYDIVFDEIKPVESKTIPTLSDIRTENGPRESLNVRCQLALQAICFNVVCSRKSAGKLIVTNHAARLNNLNGQVQTRLVCMGSELFAMMCFDGQPNVSMEITQTYVEPTEAADLPTIEQIIRRCMAGAIINMSFLDHPSTGSSVHYQDGGLNSRKVSALKAEMSNQATTSADQFQMTNPVDDLLRRLSIPPPEQLLSPTQTALQMEQYNRLLVKILRAENLEQIQSYTHPYVVVELDEPAQKHMTTLGQTPSPVWDEHFLFDIDQDRSQELLFEIYSKSAEYDPRDASTSPQKFLGLAILSIEEIRRSTISNHILPLQSRPFIKDNVNGSLFVECLFVYASKQDHDEEFLFQELEMHMKHHGGHIKTAYANRDDGVLVLKIPELDSSPDEKLPSPSTNNVTRGSPFAQKLMPKAASASASPNRSITRDRTPDTMTLDGRGRSAKRPTFFSNLKKKLSLRSSRAQSLDAAEQTVSPTDFTYHPPRATSSPGRKENTPGSHLEVPGTSDSELSGGSTDALYDPSQLVVEVVENNLKKYYYVPNPILHTTRAKQLMKSGKKLHIVSDHSFVAVKLPSSTSCKVCLKAITSAFRRRGYQCRDCRIMCHKRCYGRASNFKCPSSNVSTLRIVTFA